MLRTFAVLALVVGVAFLASPASAAPQKAQMVKGTVKSADTSKSLLVINQKVKNETVDRELSITDATEFVVTDANGKTTTSNGKDGLLLLVGQTGASVQVKCDKDVNVLKVTAKLSK
jgi:hypothetical protein